MEQELYHDRLEIEIQIVDHCNENCDNCNHFANLSEQWFMSEEEFKFTIQKIKEVFVPNGYDRLMILGGEPFIHPKFKEFMQYASEELKNSGMHIDILTNGIIVNNMDDDEFETYSHLGNIVVTPYPNLKYSEKFEQRLSENKFSLLASKLFFTAPAIDFTGSQERWSERRYCPKHQIPCLFIRDYKVYMCPFSGCLHILSKKFNESIGAKEGDYLDLKNLTIEQVNDFRINGPKEVCKYCTNECWPIYWSRSKYLTKEYYNPINHYKLFMEDYDRYDEVINGCKLLPQFLGTVFANDEKFIDRIDPAFAGENGKIQSSRYLGYVDIIIPMHNITNDQIDALYKNLYNLDLIKKCHIYIVFDECDNIKAVFDRFYTNCNITDRLNVTFLKTPVWSGPGAARQLAIDNSYNPALFFLDADDAIINKEALEKMYKILMGKKVDLVSGASKLIDLTCVDKTQNLIWDPRSSYRGDAHCILYSREFLKKNNIRYNSYFINEDGDFMNHILYYNPKVALYLIPSYQYNKNTETSVGHLFSLEERALYRIIMAINRPKYTSLDNQWIELELGNLLYGQFENYSKDEVSLLLAYAIYFGYKFYHRLNPEEQTYIKSLLNIMEEGDYQSALLTKIINNDLMLVVNGKKIDTLEGYASIIKNTIENSKFKDNIMLNLKGWLD